MKPTEAEFCAQYEDKYVVQRLARGLYSAIHPTGMHTNGPCYVQVEASQLNWLLQYHKAVVPGEK